MYTRYILGLIVLLTCFLFITGCDLIDPDPEATINAPEEAVLDGEGLYLRDCASCHGIDGVPVADDIIDIRNYPGGFELFNESLDVGPTTMPRYPELDEEQRQMLYDYVVTQLGK